MSRDINKLVEPFRTQVKELIKQAKAKGLPIIVTSTTRTKEEQRELVSRGYSKTMKSKHLIGEAVDLAFIVEGKLSYSTKLYEKLYMISRQLDYIIWPYIDLDWRWDLAHFQLDINKHEGGEDSMYEEKYKQEVADHKESIKEKELNYQRWQEQIEATHKAEEELRKTRESIRVCLTNIQ